MYITMVHNALREGKRASRYALLQSDAILEVFRRHKSELRMQLLVGSAAQRARLLRGAFMVCSVFCRCDDHTVCLRWLMWALLSSNDPFEGRLFPHKVPKCTVCFVHISLHYSSPSVSA